jgi:hypothetical protein
MFPCPSQSIVAALVCSITLGVLSCGGKVGEDTGDEGAENAGGGSSSAHGGESGAGAAPGSGIALDDCELGFLPDNEPTAPCNWVVEGRCYETKLEACACACPRGQSTCASGFPEEDGRVDVWCD